MVASSSTSAPALVIPAPCTLAAPVGAMAATRLAVTTMFTGSLPPEKKPDRPEAARAPAGRGGDGGLVAGDPGAQDRRRTAGVEGRRAARPAVLARAHVDREAVAG